MENDTSTGLLPPSGVVSIRPAVLSLLGTVLRLTTPIIEKKQFFF